MPQARGRRHHASRRVLPLRQLLGLRCSRDPTVLPGVAAVWIPAGDGVRVGTCPSRAPIEPSPCTAKLVTTLPRSAVRRSPRLTIRLVAK